jgi:predicted  nucleic acid-binding Zn-ribbon protein
LEPEVMLNLMVELAGLEEELATAQATVAHHTRRDRHLTELQAEYESDAAAAAAADRSTASTLRQAEGRIRDTEAALAHKRDQVIGISDRRHYQALQKEIKALEVQLDRLENRALDLLDQMGNQDQHLSRARQERDAQVRKGSVEQARMERETVKAQAAEEEITAEIERLIGLLPPAISRHVERLRKQYDQAVVRVQEGTCGGCSSLLPTQQGIDAAQGRALVRCPSCARFVVRLSYQ